MNMTLGCRASVILHHVWLCTEVDIPRRKQMKRYRNAEFHKAASVCHDAWIISIFDKTSKIGILE